MKAMEEWLRPLAYQGGNERDENATDEPECPFPLDDDTTIKPSKVLLLHCKTWLFLSF